MRKLLRLFFVACFIVLFGATGVHAAPSSWGSNFSDVSGGASKVVDPIIEGAFADRLQEEIDKLTDPDNLPEHYKDVIDPTPPKNPDDLWTSSGAMDNLLTPEPKIYNRLYRSYIQEAGFCWFCPMMEKLLMATDSLTAHVLNKLASTFAILVSLGLLFFILFKTGQMLIQLQEVNPAQYLEELIGPLGRGMIAVILLLGTLPGGQGELPGAGEAAGAATEAGSSVAADSGASLTNPGETQPLIFKYGLNDILMLSFDLSSSVLKSAGLGLSPTEDEQLDAYHTTSSERVSGSSIEVTASAINPKIFDADVIWTMMDWMIVVSKPLTEGMVVGATLVYHATFEDVSYKIFPNLLLLVVGLLLIVSYFLAYIMIPFQLLDAFLRLAFVCALTPFWIVLWVFPSTRQYTKKAFQVFLGVCFFFIAASVVLALILKMYEEALSLSADSVSGVETGIKAAVQKMKQDQIKEGVAALDISGMTPFLFLGVGLIAWNMLKAIGSLASAFESAGSEISASQNVMQMTNAVKNVAVDTAVAGMKLGGKGIRAGYRRAKKWHQNRPLDTTAPASLRHYETATAENLKNIRAYSKTAKENAFQMGRPEKGASSVRRTDKGAVVQATDALGNRVVKTYDENGLKQVERFDSAQHSIISDKMGRVIGERQYIGTNGDFIQTNRDGSRLISQDGLLTKTKQVVGKDGKIREEVVSSQVYGADRSQIITTEKNEDGTVSVITENHDATNGNRLTSRQTKKLSAEGETLSETDERFTYDQNGNFKTRDTYQDGEISEQRVYDETGYRDTRYENGKKVKSEQEESRTFFGQRREK